MMTYRAGSLPDGFAEIRIAAALCCPTCGHGFDNADASIVYGRFELGCSNCGETAIEFSITEEPGNV